MKMSKGVGDMSLYQ